MNRSVAVLATPSGKRKCISARGGLSPFLFSLGLPAHRIQQRLRDTRALARRPGEQKMPTALFSLLHELTVAMKPELAAEGSAEVFSFQHNSTSATNVTAPPPCRGC